MTSLKKAAKRWFKKFSLIDYYWKLVGPNKKRLKAAQRRLGKTKEIKCVWNMGTPCKGEVREALMFDKQLRIPVCKRHFKDHMSIMSLHDAGFDSKILKMTEEQRKRKIKKHRVDCDVTP